MGTLCGVISSFFEGSMYIFVFMWTPLLKSFLKEDDDELPFGMIFAAFMVCCMTGSSLFSILVEKFPVEKNRNRCFRRRWNWYGNRCARNQWHNILSRNESIRDVCWLVLPDNGNYEGRNRP